MGCLMICSRLVNTRARLRNLLGSVSISVGQEWVEVGGVESPPLSRHPGLVWLVHTGTQ